MQEIELSLFPLGGPIASSKEWFVAAWGDKNRYSEWDWKRLSYTFSVIPKGGRFLDVGVGSGQFINAVAQSGAFSEVHGVDIRKHSLFKTFTSFEMHYCSVENLPFADKHFDVVTCMEVLEHLDEPAFVAGLSELRRVCRDRLHVTLPFNEPLPIAKFHKQRFTPEKIAEHFPSAEQYLLKRNNVHWILLIEG